jgi:hypothetical protein
MAHNDHHFEIHTTDDIVMWYGSERTLGFVDIHRYGSWVPAMQPIKYLGF